MKSKKLKWLIIISCSLLALILNLAIIDKIIIPDPCYYHFNEMNSFMIFFYSASPASGGHPEPNILNLLVTIIIGGLLGKGLIQFISNKK